MLRHGFGAKECQRLGCAAPPSGMESRLQAAGRAQARRPRKLATRSESRTSHRLKPGLRTPDRVRASLRLAAVDAQAGMPKTRLRPRRLTVRGRGASLPTGGDA